MEFSEIRRRVIVAMFSDDVLLGRLALKGGNALDIVHRVLSRGSVDVDFSIAGEFEDLDDTSGRIFKALRREFAKVGYIVFDETFQVVPKDLVDDQTPWWGGYFAEFKLIEEIRANALGNDLVRMRIRAAAIDPQQGRKFRVDISKHEYCEGKMLAQVDGHIIYVYTEEMCVVEKFRAICQQMPEYRHKHPRPRARDFYDIYTTVTRRALDLTLPENGELFRHIFAAKHVPVALLSRIAEVKDFHEPDWDAVKATVVGDVFEFDTYFNFVVEEASRLHAIWDE